MKIFNKSVLIFFVLIQAFSCTNQQSDQDISQNSESQVENFASPDSISDNVKRSDALQINRKLFIDSLPKPFGYINDYEGLYTSENIISLRNACIKYKKSDSVEIGIVTIDSSFVTKDKFEELTLKLARSWGVGNKLTKEGILICISKGHRMMRIQTSDNIRKRISNNEVQTIVQNYFIPGFKSGDYFGGTLNGLNKLAELLKKNQ